MAQVACSVLAGLRQRGVLKDATTQSLSALLAASPSPAAYAGFDPTARSLHVGNLAVMVALRQLQSVGFKPVWLLGGMTGSIGDPSGKSSERPVLGDGDLQENLAGVSTSIEEFLQHSSSWLTAEGREGGQGEPPCIVNNADHYAGMGVGDFFRIVGRHMRVSSMLARESVAARMGDGKEGVSLTELTYQAFQAYDFATLQRSKGAVLQVGGSDQWGNICAGIDLTSRLHSAQVHGVTVPLLTTKAGVKFGKSEGNAVWLNANMTSHYEFYQYLMGVHDEDVGGLLNRITLLSQEEVQGVMAVHAAAPEDRAAQRALASHTTRITRGEAGLLSAQASTQVLFGGAPVHELTLAQLQAASAAGGGGVPSCTLPPDAILGRTPAAIAAAAGAVPSASEGKRLLKSGGLYLNGERATAGGVTAEQLLHGCALVLRCGKRKHCIVFLA